MPNQTEPVFICMPVLSRELIGVGVRCGYLDATVGGGGHSRLILEAAPDVQVTVDRDEQAIAAKNHLGKYDQVFS